MQHRRRVSGVRAHRLRLEDGRTEVLDGRLASGLACEGFLLLVLRSSLGSRKHRPHAHDCVGSGGGQVFPVATPLHRPHGFGRFVACGRRSAQFASAVRFLRLLLCPTFQLLRQKQVVEIFLFPVFGADMDVVWLKRSDRGCSTFDGLCKRHVVALWS